MRILFALIIFPILSFANTNSFNKDFLILRKDLNSDGVDDEIFIKIKNCESSKSCRNGNFQISFILSHPKLTSREALSFSSDDFENIIDLKHFRHSGFVKNLHAFGKNLYGFSFLRNDEGSTPKLFIIDNGKVYLAIDTSEVKDGYRSTPATYDENSSFITEFQGKIFGDITKLNGIDRYEEFQCFEKEGQHSVVVNFLKLNSKSRKLEIYKKSCVYEKKYPL